MSDILSPLNNKLREEVFKSLFVSIGKKYNLFEEQEIEASIKEIIEEYFADTADVLSIEEMNDILEEEKIYLIDAIFCQSINLNKIPEMVQMQDIQIEELSQAISVLQIEKDERKKEFFSYVIRPFLWHRVKKSYLELKSIRKTLRLSSDVLEDLYQEMRFIHRTLSRLSKI